LINMGGNRFIERRIAAKDPLNPNDRTPELTLGEALEKSIGMYLDEENKNFYFINEETGTKHIISPDLVHLVFDKKTGKKIKEEQERKPDIKTIYGMTIRPGMNIQINVPVLYDDFTEKSGQCGVEGTMIQNMLCIKVNVMRYPHKRKVYIVTLALSLKLYI
ncbi:hypothetical protein M5W80_20580, partial [Paenibacillus larvae]|nr:hypothetical protein [Paenibacillus larvae]